MHLDFRFGYAEHVLNDRPPSKLDTGRALAEIALLMISTFERSTKDIDECLVRSCDGQDSNCRLAREFEAYRNGAMRNSNNYSTWVKTQIVNSLPPGLSVNDPEMIGLSKLGDDRSCRKMATDFLILWEFMEIMKEVELEQLNHGSLMKWLYTNIDDQDMKEEMFASLIPMDKYPELYSSHLGSSNDHQSPNLVKILNQKFRDGSNLTSQPLVNLKFSPTLMTHMRYAHHPPHLAEVSEDGTMRPVANAAFPFCFYQNKQRDGVKFGPYRELYCNDFQTTINEKGLCYTYNNYNLGMDPMAREEAFYIRQVKGCGKGKGLQLVVDSQKLSNQHLSKWGTEFGEGFEVFITVPGVVTHKVTFTVDPSFNGEHHFYLHGIHFIDASGQFKIWNTDAQVCYFPPDKPMKYFAFYTQDNCLLECRYEKISALCGCKPWYLNQTDLPICGIDGNACFDDLFKNYQDELQDRVDCDCRSDCGGIHFFASMNRYPFTDSTVTDIKFWWDREKKSGKLANYLLDPLNVFNDRLSKNLTRIKLNATDDVELASKRFENDIAILNFFFDTPIITRITLEMRITVFDQISAIGGTLGLFTGVSLITFAELIYWCARFFLASVKQASRTGNIGKEVRTVSPISNDFNSSLGSQYQKSNNNDYYSNLFN